MKHTIEEYKEIGALFKQVNDIVVKLVVEASAFGKIKYSRPIGKALDTINQIRSDLEEAMFKKLPEEATTHIFYGER